MTKQTALVAVFFAMKTSDLTHIIQKDLTKNASGQITDHYDLPQNPSVLSWR